MTIKELIKKDIDNRYFDSKETVLVEQDIEVSVSSCSCLCSVEIRAPLSDPTKAQGIVRQMDESQSLVRYHIDDNRFVLSSSMWIDRKPTQKGLNEVFNFLLADFKSKRLLVEAFTKGVL